MNFHPRAGVLSDEHDSSHIGRLLEIGKLSRAEFEAAKIWREVYIDYLGSIGSPGYTRQEPMSDLRCEELKRRVYRGIEELKEHVGRTAFHRLNALVVYDEPEELGDFDFTIFAARSALAHLVRVGI